MKLISAILALSAATAFAACEQTPTQTSSLVQTTGGGGSGSGGDSPDSATPPHAGGTGLADAAPCVLSVATDPPSCSACLTTSCCAYTNACLGDKACVDLLTCYRGCTADAGAPKDASGETGNCFAKCNATKPGASVSAGANYATCLQANCAAHCTM